jgi:endo-beta-N-acetylglucosaminidase D
MCPGAHVGHQTRRRRSDLDTRARRELRRLLQRDAPGALVLWYDAVTTEGRLRWQDTLNELNAPFFDACDGIFVNYAWRVPWG